MKTVRKTLEERKREYRTIYELLEDKPRINVKNIASVLESDRHSASKRLKEAFAFGYVEKPQIRKRSYQNMKEYMYFVRLDNPLEAFEIYGSNGKVVYQAVMGGYANFWIIAKEELAVDGHVVVKGLRSDYYVAYAPDVTWDTAFTRIYAKIDDFDPAAYTPRGVITNHWHEPAAWDEEDEKLCSAFQYDLRKKLAPVMKENLVSGEKLYKWFDHLNQTCTVFTRFFPERIAAYDPYLFMIDTPYDDFVIDLFSQFPTSTMFFKVGSNLFCYCNVKKTYVKQVAPPVTDIKDLKILFMLKMLSKKRFISDWWHASIEYYGYR